ncbi:MAG: preprotein translocase subunit SecY [Acidimicrobiia bacterium]
MLSRLRNMFRVPDLRNKLLFTLAIVALYRLGAHIQAPYLDIAKIRGRANGGSGGILDFFSGGALSNFAIFALGIQPYITSSIIMQLLGVVIPRLEKLQQEGQSGQKKITQWTRYMTVILALIQSTGLMYTLKNGGTNALIGSNVSPGTIKDFTMGRGLLVVLTFTAGTAMVMWFGELISQRGVGQGMSILIFASVISRMPTQGNQILLNKGVFALAVVIAIGIAMIVGIVYIESGQRRIPINFAKRVVGRRMYGGSSSYIPLKVNQSGVIPAIFATSILSFPVLIAQWIGNTGFQTFVADNFGRGTGWLYISILIVLIVAFSFFYNSIAFNPQQQSDIIRKQGGFIPGIRPGPPTERYLQKIVNRITFPGSMFLAIIVAVPLIVLELWSVGQFPFGGTAMLIAVGVSLETMRQIDSQLMMRNYEGFLR